MQRRNAISIGIRLSHAVLGYLAAVLLARILGVEEFGIYAFAFAAIGILAMPVQHGLAALVVRETSRQRAANDCEAGAALWLWSNRLAWRIAFPLIALAVVLVTFLPRELLTAGGYAIPLLLALPLMPIGIFGAIRGSVLIGSGKVALGQLPEYVIRPLTFILLLLIIAGTTRDLSQSGSVAMVCQVAAAMCSLVASSFLLRRMRKARRAKRLNKVQVHEWKKALPSLMAISGIHYLIVYSDLVLLGLLRSSEEVGLYRAANQTALLVPFILQAVNAVMAPMFAALYHRQDKSELQRLIYSGGMFTVVLTIPIFGVIVLFGSVILGVVFGADFRDAYSALAILALGQFINVIAGPVTYLLTMTGHENGAARILFGCAILNVALSIVLIPKFGILGAAVGSAISVSVANLLLRRFVQSTLDVESSVLGVIKMLLSQNEPEKRKR